ncbi:MAG: energy-coupling factor transporter ATPase [Oscillospiraceae bacterium]|nr:energy-coupling factor transporter ATPase [Oscillospiraceae bacterium]
MEIIKTENLYFDYEIYDDKGNVVEKNPALHGVNLTVQKGEFLAVLGHNGSGKSTLAKHFNGILLPSRGKVFVNNIDVSDDSRIYEIRQTVGMVFQNPDNQIVAAIVEEDVAFALENLGVPPDEIRERIDEAMKLVDIYKYHKHAPHRLSGGQKQRVAIAGVIAMRPMCIVLDEPTAMLDPKGRKEVMGTIKMLNEKGITIVLITHYMEEAAQARRVVVMDKGAIIMDGTPKEIFSEVEKLKAVGLDVPQVTELAYELRKAGVKLPANILNEDECAKELAVILKEGRDLLQ